MRKVAVTFLIAIGLGWALFVIWMLLAIAGVAGPPISIALALLYWVAVLVGPLSFILGSMFVFNSAGRSIATALIAIGCIIFTGEAFYAAFGVLHVQPLQVRPPYALYAVWFGVVVLTDVVGYRLLRGSAR
jgi:hypothetical protein